MRRMRASEVRTTKSSSRHTQLDGWSEPQRRSHFLRRRLLSPTIWIPLRTLQFEHCPLRFMPRILSLATTAATPNRC